jgi:hypothetical protein
MFPPMTRLPLLMIAAVLAADTAAFGDQLLESGTFEWPVVTKRKSRAEGADLTKSAMSAQWRTFRDKSEDKDGKEGKLVLGLTNEISRSGRQSLFAQFDKLTKKNTLAILSSDLISVQPGQTYRIGIYGRVDKKDPLALDGRIPWLQLRVDWFKNGVDEDSGEPAIEQVGNPDTNTRAEQLPGGKTRKPYFVSTEWKPMAYNFKAPDDAEFVKVTWIWQTTQQDGESQGVMYFDDAIIEGPAGPKVDPFADDPEIQAEMKATENDPNLVKPDEDKPINVTPLTPPAAPKPEATPLSTPPAPAPEKK